MIAKQKGEVLRGEFVGCVEKIEAWHTRAYVSEIVFATLTLATASRTSSRKIARKTSRKDKE